TAGIVPPYPPLPMPLNLPFQPVNGNRTSNWIEESLVGVATPFTLQFAGRPPPAGTMTTLVILAPGSEREVRLSPDWAAEASAGVSTIPAKSTINAGPIRHVPSARNGRPDRSHFVIGVAPAR